MRRGMRDFVVACSFNLLTLKNFQLRFWFYEIASSFWRSTVFIFSHFILPNVFPFFFYFTLAKFSAELKSIWFLLFISEISFLTPGNLFVLTLRQEEKNRFRKKYCFRFRFRFSKYTRRHLMEIGWKEEKKSFYIYIVDWLIKGFVNVFFGFQPFNTK